VQEVEAQDDVLVFRRINVVAQLVGSEPELGFEAEMGGGVFGGTVRFGASHANHFTASCRARHARKSRLLGGFQGTEHILQICEAFAGLPAGRADVLRRAFVKEKVGIIEEIGRDFMAAARALGRGEEDIARVWALGIEPSLMNPTILMPSAS
jgi:hypothetical protein